MSYLNEAYLYLKEDVKTDVVCVNTYSYRSPKWLFTGGIVVHCTLLYLQTQMRFLIGGKRVTCRGSKSLTPKGNNNLSFRLARDQVGLFETAANL